MIIRILSKEESILNELGKENYMKNDRNYEK